MSGLKNRWPLPRIVGNNGRHIYSGWNAIVVKNRRVGIGDDSLIHAGFDIIGVPLDNTPTPLVAESGDLLITSRQVTRS